MACELRIRASTDVPGTFLKMLLALMSVCASLAFPPDFVSAQSTMPSAPGALAGGYMRLGQMYAEGTAVQRDLEKALLYYRRAQQAGSDEAQMALNMLPYKVEGTGLDKREALAGLRELAARGKVSALLLLAEIYAGSYGDEPDPEQALASLREAADRGNIDAMMQIGDYYRKGEIVPYDALKAVAAYGRAESAGSRAATEQLVVFQAYGEGMARDAAAAMARLEAAEPGSGPSALVTEGDLRLKAGIPAIDVAGALEAWTKAADQGRIDAMIRLGDFYLNGFFARQERKKALAYYQAAANTGDLYGRLALAKAQLTQDGTAEDGLRQLEALAENGFDEAGVTIANAHLRGTGVPKNVEVGLRRLESMAETGSILARLRLVEIYRSGLEDGHGRLVRANAARAGAILKEIGPSIGSSLWLYHNLLLEASTGKAGDTTQLLRKLEALPISIRHRLFKELRVDLPDLYFDLIQLKLVDAGYLAADQDGWKPTIRAMMTYCRDRGVGDVCASGPFAPRTAEALQALL